MDILTWFGTVRLTEQFINWSDYVICINVHSNSPVWYMCQVIRISIDIGQWLRHSNLKCQLHTLSLYVIKGSSWPWSYGSWIYNYLCNQWLSPLMLWVRLSIRARCTTLCDTVCQWLATGWWFSSGPPVSSTNKTDSYDITEILLKVALSTFKQTNDMQSWLKSVIVWYINGKNALNMCHCDIIWVRLQDIFVLHQPMS